MTREAGGAPELDRPGIGRHCLGIGRKLGWRSISSTPEGAEVAKESLARESPSDRDFGARTVRCVRLPPSYPLALPVVLPAWMHEPPSDFIVAFRAGDVAPTPTPAANAGRKSAEGHF